MRLEAGAGRDQVAEDDVLLQADEVVDLAGQGRLGQHLGRLLEAGGRDEAVRLHGGLGDAQQLRQHVAGVGAVVRRLLAPSASRRARSSSYASLLTILPSSNCESPAILDLHALLMSRSLTSRKANLSITEPGNRPVSPIVSTFTLRSICATMISMCLSSMSTRWLR